MNGVLMRGLLALALLSGAALGFGAPAALVDRLIPPWRHVIEWLEPDFRVVDLRTDTTGTEALIQLVVTPARVILVGNRAIVPEGDERAAASMSRGSAWLMLTVFTVALLAWPAGHGAREWLARAALGVPALAVLLLLDVPINLLGPLRAMVSGIAFADADAWILGARFLRNGGRTMVALAAAGAIGMLGHTLTRPRRLP